MSNRLRQRLSHRRRWKCFGLKGGPGLIQCGAAIAVLLWGAAVPRACAQSTLLSRSVSGQFLIQTAPGPSGSPLQGVLQNDTNFVRLDPVLLTVSCERIKQLVWRALDASTPWKSKIFLRLHQAASLDEPIWIESEQFRDGWRYQVSLPIFCNRERYVRAIVRVLLLELANRNAGAHTAELPTWLAEGLAREIWASDEAEVILPPPQSSASGLAIRTLLVNARRSNPLEQAHQELCAATPLSFQELSWPEADPLTGEPSELYRSSSQVFTHALLSLPNGAVSLRTMIESLPRYYNWQFAFLDAYRDEFRQSLDIEKWWSLQLAHFTGRGLAENWSADESWEKLDELVRSAVQIRIGTNELPLHAEVTLQTIIRDWPQPRQTAALQTKLAELQLLRPRLAHDLVPLVDAYCAIIESHVHALNHTGFVLPFRKHAVARRNASEAIQQLDQLDSRRQSLRPVGKADLSTRVDAQATP